MQNGNRLNNGLALITRRRFVSSAGVAAAVATSGLGSRSLAEELPRVDEDGATARALGYVHDAGSVDAAKRASDRFCNNCALYAGGSDDEWAGCSVFPGKLVANKGWCLAWAPKQ